jgi:predicted dehydrogenase
MKYLITGLGSIGRRHLRNLLMLGERDILFYRTHHSTLPEDELLGFPVETDLQTALAHKPDAVIVSNPTALHLDVAIPAAEAGCHLFLEKPVSHNLDRIDQLKQAVHLNNLRVFVGFQFRFHLGLRQIAQLLSEKVVGEPVSVRAHWGEYLPGWHPWEDYRQGYSARPDLGGGVVLTLCHPFDYLRWLFGEVDALWALTGNQGGLGLKVEDTAEIGLRFASGVLGSVHLNFIQRPPAHWLEIIGTDGTMRWDYYRNTVEILAESTQETASQSAVSTQLSAIALSEIRNQMFVAEMRHFLDILQGNKQPVCTLDDGIRALELALAVHESTQKKKLTGGYSSSGLGLGVIPSGSFNSATLSHKTSGEPLRR